MAFFTHFCCNPWHEVLRRRHGINRRDDALFCETSPGPLKYASSLLGLSSSETRMPIVEIYDASKEKVKNALKIAELL